MENNNLNSLTVRRLTEGNAFSYALIADPNDADLKEFATFFVVSNFSRAREMLKSGNFYGLFQKSKLVAVFAILDGAFPREAIVHYFVAKQYRGNNFAYIGLSKLANLFAKSYDFFTFLINPVNYASVITQKKLGSVRFSDEDCFIVFRYYLADKQEAFYEENKNK